MPENIFATILVLIILQLYATKFEDEWIMMKRKTSKYLDSTKDSKNSENHAVEIKIKSFLKSENSIPLYV